MANTVILQSFTFGCLFTISIIFVFGMVLHLTVQPVQALPTLHPFTSTPYNATMSDWLARYWNWSLSIPTSEHPRNDLTGNNCGINQNGPVWFLDPPVGEGSTTRTNTCNIPEGKTIFVPLLVSECGYRFDVDVRTVDALEGCVKPGNNHGNIKFDVDGKPLLIIKDSGEKDYETSQRILSNIFTAYYPTSNNIVGDNGTGFDTKMADGYFAMIKPLPAGDHTIKLDVQVIPQPTNYHTSMTYNLKIGGNSTTQS